MAKRLHCPLCSSKLEFFKSEELGLKGICNFQCYCLWKYKAYFHMNKYGLPAARKLELYQVGKYEVCRVAKNLNYHVIDRSKDLETDDCVFVQAAGKSPYFKTEEILEGFFLIQ